MPWRPLEESVVLELSQRLQNSGTLAVQRLRAEFPQNDIRAHLSIFDCKRSLPCMLRLTGDPDRKKVLEHVKGLATEYGFVDHALRHAVLEYRDVAGTVLALREPGQPLADASNACIWSFVVSPAFVCRGRVAPLRFLPKLARWYLSIEDGECAVERDLAAMRAVIDTARTDEVSTLEDTLVGCGGAPTSRSEVQDPATGGLTDTSRRWATRWRACHGARLGCMAAKSMKAARAKLKCKPTWQKFKKGVLVAAAGAVATEQAIGGTCLTAATCFDVPIGSLRRSESSVTGTTECDFWTKKCSQFAKVTENRNARGKFLKHVKLLHKRGANPPRKLQGVTRVCWLEPPPEDCPQAEGLLIQRGVHKCRYVDLVITDEISKLSDCQTLSADKQLVVDLIYIIASGKPVVTATAWRLANGRANDVPAPDIMRHVALAPAKLKVQPLCHLNYTQDFEYGHADVVKALQRMRKLPDSRWRAEKSATGFGTLHDLVGKLLDMRRVENTLGKKWWCAVA